MTIQGILDPLLPWIIKFMQGTKRLLDPHGFTVVIYKTPENATQVSYATVIISFSKTTGQYMSNAWDIMFRVSFTEVSSKEIA